MANDVEIVIRAKDQASKSVAELQRNVKSAGASMIPVFAAVTAAGVGLGAAFTGVVKTAANFEQSLANTQAATGATAEDMKRLREEALGIGKDTSKSAAEAAAAMGELVKAGVPVEKVVNGVARASVQMAEATGVDVPAAATLMAKALNTFTKEGLTGEQAANAFARAANASAISVTDMGYSLAAVGPVAAAAGLTMNDFATAIGIMGNNALVGSDAGTSLKAFIAGLTPNSKAASAAMKSIGFSAFDASGQMKSMSEIVKNLQTSFAGMSDETRMKMGELLFGSDGIRAMNILLKEGEAGWSQFGAAMGNAPSVAEQSAIRLKTLNGQMEMLRGSLETIAIAVGSVVLPALTNLAKFGVDVLNGFIENGLPLLESYIAKFDELFTAAKQVAEGALKLVSAETETLIPKLIDAAGNAARLAMELGSIIVKAAELTQTFQSMNGTSDETNQKLSDMFGAAGLAVEVLGRLAGVAADVVKWLGEQEIVIGAVAKGMDTLVEKFLPGLDILDKMTLALPYLRAEFDKLANTLGTSFNGLPEQMRKIGTDIVQGLIDGIRSKFEEAKRLVETMANDLAASARSTLGIRSPSTVFAEIGRQSMAGMYIGIEDGAKRVVNLSRQISAQVAAAAAPPGMHYNDQGGLSLGPSMSTNGVSTNIGPEWFAWWNAQRQQSMPPATTPQARGMTGGINITVQGSILSERELISVVQEGLVRQGIYNVSALGGVG